MPNTHAENASIRMIYEAVSGLSAEKATDAIVNALIEHRSMTPFILQNAGNRLGRAADELERTTR